MSCCLLYEFRYSLLLYVYWLLRECGFLNRYFKIELIFWVQPTDFVFGVTLGPLCWGDKFCVFFQNPWANYSPFLNPFCHFQLVFRNCFFVFLKNTNPLMHEVRIWVHFWVRLQMSNEWLDSRTQVPNQFFSPFLVHETVFMLDQFFDLENDSTQDSVSRSAVANFIQDLVFRST